MFGCVLTRAAESLQSLVVNEKRCGETLCPARAAWLPRTARSCPGTVPAGTSQGGWEWTEVVQGSGRAHTVAKAPRPQRTSSSLCPLDCRPVVRAGKVPSCGQLVFFFLFFFGYAIMWDLSSLTRDRTPAPRSGSTES